MMELRFTGLHKERLRVGKSCINEFSATSVYIGNILSAGKSLKKVRGTRV